MCRWVLGVFLLILTGCPAPPKPPPEPKDTDWCKAAEQTLERLQCKDSHDNPMWVNKRGERFQETCEQAQIEGLIFLNPKCVAEAKTCEGANECPATPH